MDFLNPFSIFFYFGCVENWCAHLSFFHKFLLKVYSVNMAAAPVDNGSTAAVQRGERADGSVNYRVFVF